MNLTAMQAEVSTWHRREFPEVSLSDITLKLCEEAGEVARCVGSISAGARVDRGEVDWPAILEDEAADVLVALLALADRYGFDLSHAWERRFLGTVRHRRYASVEALPLS